MSHSNKKLTSFSPNRASIGALALVATGCGAEGFPHEDIEESRAPVIFGADERLDFGAMSAAQQDRARSVALHVLSSGLTCSAGSCSLSTTAFTTDPEAGGRLCETVRFKNQLAATAGKCTAWLVGPNLVATAGHCIDSSTCSSSRYVFGFHAAANGGSEVTTFPQADVYSCSSVVSQVFSGTQPTNQDYAVVRLDRNVLGRTPFIVRHSGQVANAAQLTIYGHPSVLPLKLTQNVAVQDNTFVERLYANGDVFGGNSGGPVLNLMTGVAEGITVTQPPPRFVWSTDSLGACREYRVCPDTGCSDPSVGRRFTGVTRSARVLGIPLHAALITAVIGT